MKEVNLFKKEQQSDEFLKVNPQHTVPVLVDDDYVLSESRAIATYLAEKNFPGGHSLYPLDAKKRGIINNRLYYECTVLYPRIRAICVSCFGLLQRSYIFGWQLHYVLVSLLASGIV